MALRLAATAPTTELTIVTSTTDQLSTDPDFIEQGSRTVVGFLPYMAPPNQRQSSCRWTRSLRSRR